MLLENGDTTHLSDFESIQTLKKYSTVQYL